jgi:hypothetical protein
MPSGSWALSIAYRAGMRPSSMLGLGHSDLRWTASPRFGKHYRGVLAISSSSRLTFDVHRDPRIKPRPRPEAVGMRPHARLSETIGGQPSILPEHGSGHVERLGRNSKSVMAYDRQAPKSFPRKVVGGINFHLTRQDVTRCKIEGRTSVPHPLLFWALGRLACKAKPLTFQLGPRMLVWSSRRCWRWLLACSSSVSSASLA